MVIDQELLEYTGDDWNRAYWRADYLACEEGFANQYGPVDEPQIALFVDDVARTTTPEGWVTTDWGDYPRKWLWLDFPYGVWERRLYERGCGFRTYDGIAWTDTPLDFADFPCDQSASNRIIGVTGGTTNSKDMVAVCDLKWNQDADAGL
jgi:hypothetical protein